MTVNFANPNSNDSTTINLYNNQGKKQKISYTHSDGGTIDNSGERESLLLVGNNTGSKGSSKFTAGSGNDTAIGGAGDYFDLGSGYNRVELKSDRGNNDNGATIAMTATGGKTEVNGFNSGFDDSGDKISLDIFGATVSYKNGQLTFSVGNASLVLNFTDNSSDLAESADLINNDNFVDNVTKLDDITTITYEQEDYQNFYNTSYAFSQNSIPDDLKITFSK